ncbi:MAG: alpha-L-fucosidase [Ginsengibacter sp.]
MKIKGILFFILIFFVSILDAQHLPIPTPQQVEWHEMEFYLFMHFGPNTFTDKEWGLGDEPENVFNPEQLDCKQWCRIAKAAGAKGIIITAKHHDGFCLWPSKYSTHTVRESAWKNGRGDVLKELSAACAAYGLKFGVYLSPWDRNHPKYGTAEYNDVFVNMLKEIFSNYGPVWELWWDGANGEGPNGKKQEYDWQRFEKTVEHLSPNTLVFSDIGPHIRWVGNENGIAATTNWNTLDTAGFKRGEGAPPTDSLSLGNVNGNSWIPAECDVSIRPGWFYHPEENDRVKSPGELFQLYLKSVGRGANLLLNVPPDRKGLISRYDSASLVGFKNLRTQSFGKDLSKGFHLKTLEIEFNKSTPVDCIVLKENLRAGQHCKKFTLFLFDDHHRPIKKIDGTTIGHKRIITFLPVALKTIRLKVVEQVGNTVLSQLAAYNVDEKLIEK